MIQVRAEARHTHIFRDIGNGDGADPVSFSFQSCWLHGAQCQSTSPSVLRPRACPGFEEESHRVGHLYLFPVETLPTTPLAIWTWLNPSMTYHTSSCVDLRRVQSK